MTTTCRACGGALGRPDFSGKLIGESVDYFECARCGYVQTQQPTWLDRAYGSAINDSDTGIMVRNQHNVRIVLATLAALGRRSEPVVDCAGGYGILVRLLRDMGVDARWSDPYCKNLLAVGFEHDGRSPAGLVTAFEALEHFVDPADELARLFRIAPCVLLSTEIIATPAPKPSDWWYYGPDHGQHIGFFRVRTLQMLAARFQKHLITDGSSYHLLADRAVSPRLWRFYRRVAQRAPSLLTRGLRSKVWDDFERMRRGSAGRDT